MAGEPEVQVSHFLDDHGLGSFQIKLLFWSVLIAFIDGYDIGAIAFAAPHLISEWHVPPKALGIVLSASNFGVLFGSQIFGWIGDRYGRKTALITANILFGIFTYWAAYSTNLNELSLLRFIAGLGIGGVIPNVVAINAESAPRHLRATLAIIASGMVPLGGALAGFASAAFVPQYGWPILFKIGGIAPIVFALAAIFGLSESIKYMALHDGYRSKIAALIKAIRPDFQIPPNARFVIEDEQQSPSSSPLYLFGNGLAAITPLTWLMFAFNLMGYFFLLSWTPTLMIAAKATPTVAALAGAALQVGGTVGSLTLCWWLARQRFLAIAILFVIAVPIVTSIGYAGLTSTSALLTATFFAGAVVLGIQSGINVVGAMIYPTSLRTNGSGWATRHWTARRHHRPLCGCTVRRTSRS
jgi:MFS transporter, AAHS family, 4-hydroxybenzoate transporter